MYDVFIRYGLDLNMERVEDVLLHQKILADAEDPDKRPIFHVRFMKVQKVPENACHEYNPFHYKLRCRFCGTDQI